MTTLCIADASPELQRRIAERKEELEAQGKHLLQRGSWPNTSKRLMLTVAGDLTHGELQYALATHGLCIRNGEICRA